MKNLTEIVSNMYESFGKGDIPAIIAQLAEDVRWEEWNDNSAQKAGVPWLKSGKGKEAAIEFFKVVAGMKFNKFDVLSIMGGGNQVAAEVVIDAEFLSNGAIVNDEEIHLWTFNEAGKIIRFRHYLDTAKHIQAASL